MVRSRLPSLVLLLGVTACSSDPLPTGVPDHAAVPVDAAAPRDLTAPVGPTCGKAPWATVAGTTLAGGTVDTFREWFFNCCGQARVVRLSGTAADGSTVRVLFLYSRFPTVPPAAQIDLANPPPGWVFGATCEPPGACGGTLAQSNSEFSGTLAMEARPFPPGTFVTACVSMKPRPESTWLKPLQLAVDHALVDEVCTPGLDQTCNADPKISSLHGRCEPDATCTCLGGFQRDQATQRCL